MAQKFHFAILRVEVTRAWRGLSATAEQLVYLYVGFPTGSDWDYMSGSRRVDTVFTIHIENQPTNRLTTKRRKRNFSSTITNFVRSYSRNQLLFTPKCLPSATMMEFVRHGDRSR